MKTILFMGDSITDTGRPRDKETHLGFGYAGQVAGELGYLFPGEYQFLNRGISGNRVVDLYARTRIDMIQLKPDYMSILIGVNDVWHESAVGNGVPAQKFELVYSLMLEELFAELPNMKVMLLEPFVLHGTATCNTEDRPNRWEYFRDEVAVRARIVRKLAEKYGLPFVPLQAEFDRVSANMDPAYWLWDGVHPTHAGHDLIKRAWIKGFEELK